MYPRVSSSSRMASFSSEDGTAVMPHRFENMPSSDVLIQLAGAKTQEEVEAVIDNNPTWLTERLKAKQAGSNFNLHRLENVDSSLVLNQLAGAAKGPFDAK